jgi:hypothetical protein
LGKERWKRKEGAGQEILGEREMEKERRSWAGDMFDE